MSVIQQDGIAMSPNHEERKETHRWALAADEANSPSQAKHCIAMQSKGCQRYRNTNHNHELPNPTT
jgi:hypothetical protein